MSRGIKLQPLLLQLLPRPRPRTVFFFPNRRRINNFLKLPITSSSTFRSFSCRAMAESVEVRVKENIDLTDLEKKIFERLAQTLTHFHLDTQLRVAGGWVRDKLLGKECYDIDIAVDNMLGSEFVDKVTEYLSSAGEKAQGLAVIPSNPEQSKHLETAKMRLYNVWIDFVNLRAEDYTENADSRIPTMRFGTAEEDAYRRDLTINSLFYNINTHLVEDYTGRGIADLKSGKIVTPLPAKSTFLDDPLRVLRAIRFGARFDFNLDEKLKEAASSDEVKAALSAKISRERVGTEIDLMVSGNQPVKAMTYISDMTLFWIVFCLPPNFEPTKSEGCDRLCILYLDCARNLMQLLGCSTFSDEQRRLSLYAALFLPFRKTIYKDNKAKKVPVVNYIFRESLKRKASDAETVINVHRALERFLSLIPFLTSEKEIQLLELDSGIDIDDVPNESKLRILAGFLLRDIKDFWRVALLMSTLVYPVDVDCTQDFLEGQFQLDKKMDLFNAVEDAIIKLGLDKVWDVKPLVNGKEIMGVLRLTSGKPIVREWQQKLLAWQLAHPSQTAEQCLDWMRQSLAHPKRMKLTE